MFRKQRAHAKASLSWISASGVLRPPPLSTVGARLRYRARPQAFETFHDTRGSNRNICQHRRVWMANVCAESRSRTWTRLTGGRLRCGRSGNGDLIRRRLLALLGLRRRVVRSTVKWYLSEHFTLNGSFERMQSKPSDQRSLQFLYNLHRELIQSRPGLTLSQANDEPL